MDAVFAQMDTEDIVNAIALLVATNPELISYAMNEVETTHQKSDWHDEASTLRQLAYEINARYAEDGLLSTGDNE